MTLEVSNRLLDKFRSSPCPLDIHSALETLRKIYRQASQCSMTTDVTLDHSTSFQKDYDYVRSTVF